jgi:serine/threonine-protein kinase HipA
MSKCLYCYQELTDGQKDFHPHCAKQFFGTAEAPILPFSRSSINELAREAVLSRIAVTGVQSKLSMDVNKGGKDEPDRLTIVGLWGRFILKPKSDNFPWLPEVEDLTMHLASIARISVVPHTLIRFSDGELSYVTRRIDRDRHGRKLLMEDMCQIAQRLTADKYKSSYENVAKLVRKYSSAPMLDLVNYWEVVVFSWITGNSDMHLKNFSLISEQPGQYVLSQAYDLANIHLVFPEDDEELALTVDGKKKKISRQNLVRAMKASGLDDKVIENIFRKFVKVAQQWYAFIDKSFLPVELMEQYKQEIALHLSLLSA